MTDVWTPEERRLLALGRRDYAAALALSRGVPPGLLAGLTPREDREPGVGISERTLAKLEWHGLRLLLDAVAVGRRPPGLPDAAWPGALERDQLARLGSGPGARQERARALRAWLRRANAGARPDG